MTSGCTMIGSGRCANELGDCAGIVLCGGRSSRMGRPKAWLPWGDELLLQRVVRLVHSVLDLLVVVAAEGQELPPLPSSITVLRDEREAVGPLEGLRRGLSALPPGRFYAFATPCDLPFLNPSLIRLMLAYRYETDCVVASIDGVCQPLPAVFHRRLEPVAQSLLDHGQQRVGALAERSMVKEIADEMLRQADPELASFRNLNSPQDYKQLKTHTSAGQVEQAGKGGSAVVDANGRCAKNLKKT